MDKYLTTITKDLRNVFKFYHNVIALRIQNCYRTLKVLSRTNYRQKRFTFLNIECKFPLATGHERQKIQWIKSENSVLCEYWLSIIFKLETYFLVSTASVFIYFWWLESSYWLTSLLFIVSRYCFMEFRAESDERNSFFTFPVERIPHFGIPVYETFCLKFRIFANSLYCHRRVSREWDIGATKSRMKLIFDLLYELRNACESFGSKQSLSCLCCSGQPNQNYSL